MPIYTYRDKKTQKTVEVVRKFDEYENVPTKEEASGLTELEYNEADWERIMGSGIKVTRSPGYGTKGNWILLLAILGSYYVQNSWI